MIFLRPEILYYLLPPLFILFGFLLTQKENQEHYFSDEVMEKLRVSADTFSQGTRNIYLFLVGFLIVIALAEPVIEDGKVEIKSKSADIMIALDISDSMLAEDVYPNRLKFAKQKAIDLLKFSPEERIGVIAFAKNSYLVSPMSFDHHAVSFLLTQLNTDSITEKGTDFLALLKVVDETIKTKRKKYLLILSDGGDKDDFSTEIAYAKEKNIVVFILGIGTLKGAPVKKEDGSFIKYKGDIIVSKLNEEIATLATSSSGVYIQSLKSSSDVKAMLREIDSISEQKELKSETINKFIPLFYYPLALALFLLLIATSSLYKKDSFTSPLMVLFLAFSFFTGDVKAGLLDFMELEKAKKAYERGDYKTSAEIYEKHASDTDNAHSYFNAGNAFYKHGKYKEAVKLYEKAIFNKNEYKANKFANLGNAHVKIETVKNLEKAKKYYEESLKLVDNIDVRENLEAVKKALEKKKKDEDAGEDGDEEGKKEDKDGDKEMKKKDENKNSKDKKDSKDEKKSDEKSESEEKEEAQKDKDNKSDKKSDDEKSGEQKENEKKEQEKKKLEELEKDKKEDTKEEKAGAPLADGKANMSDAEEEKWMQKLNSEQNTFMYMLGKNKLDEETNDEKPW